MSLSLERPMKIVDPNRRLMQAITKRMERCETAKAREDANCLEDIRGMVEAASQPASDPEKVNAAAAEDRATA